MTCYAKLNVCADNWHWTLTHLLTHSWRGPLWKQKNARVPPVVLDVLIVLRYRPSVLPSNLLDVSKIYLNFRQFNERGVWGTATTALSKTGAAAGTANNFGFVWWVFFCFQTSIVLEIRAVWSFLHLFSVHRLGDNAAANHDNHTAAASATTAQSARNVRWIIS